MKNEVWEFFHRHLPGSLSIDDVLTLESAISLTLDHVIETTVETYLKSSGRDGGIGS